MNTSLIAAVLFCIFFSLQVVLQSSVLRGTIAPLYFSFLTSAASFFMLSVFRLVTERHIRIQVPKGIRREFWAATGLWLLADVSAMFGLVTSTSVNFSLISRLQIFLTYLGVILFLHEKPVTRKIVALILAFIGTGITVLRGVQIQFFTGDALFFVFTVAISTSGIIRQKMGRTMPVVSLTHAMYGVSSIVLGSILLGTSGFVPISVWWVVPVNALLAVIGFTMVNYSIMHGGATQFSLVSSLLPVFTALFAFIFLNEGVSLQQIVGGGVVLFAVWLFLRNK